MGKSFHIIASKAGLFYLEAFIQDYRCKFVTSKHIYFKSRCLAH